MKRHFLLLFSALLLTWSPLMAAGQASSPAASPAAQSADQAASDAHRSAEEAKTAATKTNAAAAVATQDDRVRPPDFLEHLVDEVLLLFDVRGSGNTSAHYAIAAVLLVAALLLRRILTAIVFKQLRKLAKRTTTALDDEMFAALEAPVATFIMLVGIFASLKVLKLPVRSDEALSYGSTVAFSLVLFWGLLRALNALLNHAQQVAIQKQMGIAAFMPWIKKTVFVIFVVFGVLLTAQSLGADVKALLAGLGIGGLAFALAAQDTLANVFGSIVVAVDQPFKIGEFIKVGANMGTVEDIGLRSTKLRLLDGSLVVMPNKMVAAEVVLNLSRFTARRVEQTIMLPHTTTPAQMTALMADFRAAITKEPEINQQSVLVRFTNLGVSSLDILIVYMTLTPDAGAWLELRERLTFTFLRLIADRGLSIAYPAQTLHLQGEIRQGEPATRRLESPGEAPVGSTPPAQQ